MIYVGIDVAKDKHDCFAINSDGEILIEKLTITNNSDGFETLYNSLISFSDSLDNIKVCYKTNLYLKKIAYHFCFISAIFLLSLESKICI